MRALVLALSAFALIAGTASAQPRDDRGDGWRGSDVLIKHGLKLPRSHQYEAYESGTYRPISVDEAADRAGRDQFVYDRTTQAWVYHPAVGGRNRAYMVTVQDAGTRNLVQDGLNLPRDHRYEEYGMLTTHFTEVDVSQVPARVKAGAWIYDRTANAWVSHPSVGGTNPQYVTGSAAASTERGWQRVHGTIERLTRARLTLLTDDGRRMTVDTEAVADSVRRELSIGERVTVMGHQESDESRLTARFIEQGAPAAAASPAWPTSRDDCKRGGWRSYGFKNQRQCVSSVGRGR